MGVVSMDKEKMGMRIGETLFIVVYLIFDLVSGIIFLNNGHNKLFLLYGIMAFVLGFGDAFHLVPRVIKNIKGETEKVKWWMNFGLIIIIIYFKNYLNKFFWTCFFII